MLSDVDLPYLSGWELLQLLRSDPETTGAAVVLMTAGRWPEAAAGEEPDGRLPKPFGLRELRSEVGRLVELEPAAEAVVMPSV